MIARAQQDPGNPPLPLYRLLPPYERFIEIPDLAQLREGDLPPGSLLALEVHDADRDWPLVREWVPRLRGRFPSVAVILWARQLGSASTIHHLAGRAAKMHAGMVLLESEPIRTALQNILTNPADLAGEVEAYLHLRGVPLTPDLSYLIRQIFELAPRSATLAELLGKISESEAGVRARFRKKGLPSPASWHRAARALHAALRIQARADTSLLRIAQSCGYSSQTAMINQISSVFGLVPRQIRGTVGWEWLLDRWVNRQRLPTRYDAPDPKRQF